MRGAGDCQAEDTGDHEQGKRILHDADADAEADADADADMNVQSDIMQEACSVVLSMKMAMSGQMKDVVN